MTVKIKMKTPTKEQIKRLQKIFTTKYGVWNEYWITAFITEWEKIKEKTK